MNDLQLNTKTDDYIESFNTLKTGLIKEGKEIYPLSIEQETLWVENSLLEENQKDALVEISSFEIEGEVDYKKLQKAFLAVLAKNPVGRSVFAVKNDIVVQVNKHPTGQAHLAER